MAPKNRTAPDEWNNRAPLDWGSVSTVSPVAVPTAVNPLLEPGEFDEIAPVVTPDVPEIEEELPQEARDNSILGKFLNVMDNIVPDDMGGMIRGESGWLANVPLYEETVGTALGGVLSGGSAVINTINWGSEQMNHLGAALMSALPGGVQTLTWDESQDISLGQVVAANAAINSRNGSTGWLINAATGGMLAAPLAEIGKRQDPENVLYSDDFNILDPKQRKEAFESGGMGQISSGFADAIWLVAADPTILGGKFTSVLRLGTKVGEFGGLSNQQLRTLGQVQRFTNKVDEQAALITELGVEGARGSGRLSAEGENFIRALEQNADQLVNHPWVRSSANQRDTRALLGATSVDRPEEAAALVGAMAGNAESWVRLRGLNVELYDSAVRALGADIFAPVGDNVFDSARAGVALTDDQIALGDDLVYELGSTRPDLFDNIKITDIPEQVAAGQLITRGGARIGPRTVRAANAWRTGSARSQFENNAFKKSSSSATSTTSRGHFVYDRIEGISGSRPLQVVRWVGRGTPVGIVAVKDSGDGTSSLREVTSWLRKSPIGQERGAQYVNRFAAARTPGERTAILREMELEVAEMVAAKHGVSRTAALAAYRSYEAKRSAAMSNISRSETKFYVDDQTGEVVKVPDFYAEIEPAYAMLDVKAFNRVIEGNVSFLRTVQEVETVADYLNSLWKVSVLLRLGYTQRNIIEGALRSFAVLGVIAANPRAWATVPGNAIAYSGAIRATRKARIQERALMTAYENLQSARNIVAQSDELQGLVSTVKSAREQIKTIRGSVPKGQKLSDEQLSQIAKLKKDISRARRQEKKLRSKVGDVSDEAVAAARQQIDSNIAEIDSISAQLEALLTVARSKTAARRRGGYAENIVDGQRLQGAFQGSEGAMAAKLSSADRTAYMTFDAAIGRRIDQLENSPDFKVLDPRKLTPKQMQSYFDEYAIRINYRYREDPVGRMILEGRSIGEIKSWLMGDFGKRYRESLSISGRRLNSEQAVDEWIDHLVRRLDNEMPVDTRLRALALDHELTPSEVAAALRGKELPTIVGRVSDELPSSLITRSRRGVDSITSRIMRGLGSIPETKLLRHPFYNRVYMNRQAEMWRLAADQGLDMSSPIIKNRINRAAHQEALKATRETMYTIEELSNAAVLLRYVSPFFPAFENSIKTWGRIAYRNPAVVGYGNILWNIPNNLGWVVDEDGNKVERSNFLVDEGHFIQWPEPVANALLKSFGPFTPGESLRTRQHGLNIIFQGGQWWFPGAGPATSIPLSYVLRGKPEDTEIIRNAVGEEIFMQLVPSGNPNANLVDALLPTTARRVRQMWAGESSDSAFVYTWNQIIEDEYIAAQLENRPFTEKDAERVKEKVDGFWAWQILSAAVMPFQSTITSKFQPQRDYWNKLIDDQSLSYPQKMEALKEQFPDFGDALLAITRSGSYTETKLQPNLETWARIYKNKDVVDKLYAIDPELVGMFGNMGTFDDPFSRAVYGEFGRMTIGPNDARVRRMMKPEEIIRNNQIKDGWSEYWQARDYIEDKAIQLGYTSLQVKEAEPLRDILDNAALELEKRYPAWGEERRLYMDKLPAFLQGARIIVQNGELMDQDSTIAALSDYMQARDYIANALDGETNRDKREQLKLIGYQAAWDLRQKDVGFADFYDQYLYRDDFRKI